MSKITYANKVAINENAEIPNINKITDDDMNEIKTVVNNNDDDMITINTNLTNATTYSTTEKIVGTWIDGKPIYRKVINYSVNTGVTSYDIASLNIDIPVKFYTIIKRTSSDYIDYETPYYVSGSDYFRSFIRVTQSNEDMSIETRLAASYTTYRQYIILEYTKKTD